MRCDDQDDDLRMGWQGFQNCGGLERGTFQIGTGCLDAALKFVAQGNNVLFHLFFAGLRGAQSIGFFLALAGVTLADEFGAHGSAASIGCVHSGLLQGIEGILDFVYFTFFHAAVGRMHGFVGGLDIDGVHLDASAVFRDRDDDVANTDGAPISCIHEMSW